MVRFILVFRFLNKLSWCNPNSKRPGCLLLIGCASVCPLVLVLRWWIWVEMLKRPSFLFLLQSVLLYQLANGSCSPGIFGFLACKTNIWNPAYVSLVVSISPPWNCSLANFIKFNSRLNVVPWNSTLNPPRFLAPLYRIGYNWNKL